MPEVGDFGDRVGTTAQAVQVPHPRPVNEDQHARNWRHLEHAVNAIPRDRTWVYQNRTAVTIAGDNLPHALATLHLAKGELTTDLWLQATVGTGTIDGYDLAYDPEPSASHALNVDQTVSGLGTTSLEVYAPGWLRYDEVGSVDLSIAFDVSDNSDVTLLWCLQTRPAKLYLF